MARSKLGVQFCIVILVLSGCNGDRRADDTSIDTGTVTPSSGQGGDPAGTFNDTGQVTITPVTPPPPPPPPNDSGQVQPSINLKAIRSAANDSGQISADTKRKR